VFGVVQHQEHAFRAEVVDEGGEQRAARLLLHAQGGGGLGDEGGLGEGREFNEPDAVRVGLEQVTLGRLLLCGAWLVLAGTLIAELVKPRRPRQRTAALSAAMAAGTRTDEAAPESRFEDRDELHQGGAKYD